MIKDFDEGPINLLSTGDGLFFTSSHQSTMEDPVGGTLWKWSAELEQVTKIIDSYFRSPGSLLISGNDLFFTAGTDDTGNPTLMRSQGTSETTISFNIYASGLVRWKNGIAFTGETSEYGRELWFSDGTLDGTNILFDLNQDQIGSEYRSGLFYQGNLIFSVGEQTWISGGTPSSTGKIADLQPLMIDPYDNIVGPLRIESYSQELDGLFYFFGFDNVFGPRLWRTDGTTGGTQMVFDPSPGESHSNPQKLIKAGNFLYFYDLDTSPDNGDLAKRLWRSDGTPEGTQIIKELEPDEDFQGMAVVNDTAWIGYGNYLYKSKADGNLELVTSFWTFDTDMDVTYPLGNYLFFSNQPEEDFRLFL